MHDEESSCRPDFSFPEGRDPLTDTMQIEINTVEVSLHVNNTARTVCVSPSERLLDTLRYRLGLTGSKEGCGEGECGACTVFIDGQPANACLIPTYQARGCHIETIEAQDGADMAALHASGATQCGACTPGVVMTATWIARHPELLETHSLRELMAGNLCRCTGYDGIIEGVLKTLAGQKES